MFYSDEEEPIVKRFISYKENVLRNNKVILTKFLNLREAELLEYVIGKSDDISLYFSSISESDEYKRAVISAFPIEPDFNISLLKIEYNKKFITLDHRHLLGNIMGLQIERNMIGDIYISREGNVYIAVSREMEDFLKNNLTVIDHQPINLINVDNIIGDFTPNMDVKKYYVASLRLDLIISERFNLSRKESQELIKAGNVKINARTELNPVHNVNNMDTISVKTKGKMKVLEIGGESKSGRIIITLGKLL
ncbi:MAG: hypothetical protein K6G28_06600 [Acholeplasmatales bacterium]|nr:hypothetical protein [Acholeplasmatales bacterium]